MKRLFRIIQVGPKVLKSEREAGRAESEPPALKEDGARSPGVQVPLGTGNGRETEPSLEPLGGAQPRSHLGFSPVKPIWTLEF